MSTHHFTPDTLQTRIRPAVRRMELAAAWLTSYQRQGHQVRVEWLDEWICLINQHGQPLEHPLGLLPELLWLLRDVRPVQDDGLADAVNRRLALDQQMLQLPKRGPRGPGGVA